MALPVAIAAGANRDTAMTCVAVFAGQFVAATVAVHAVISRTRRPPATRARCVAAAVASSWLLAVTWLAASGLLSTAAPLAVLPAWVTSCVLVAVPPSARNLRVVGWCLIATSVVTAVILVAALR
jgi:hypothetical protein